MVIILSTEPLYRCDLFNVTLVVVPQLHATAPNVKGWTVFTDVGLWACRVPVGLFFLWDKKRSFYYLTAMIVFTVVNNSLKTWYHEPRPFWLDAVDAKKCSYSFGNPSGHAMNGLGLPTLYCLDFYHSTQRSCLFAMLLLASACLGAAIVYSRVLLGVHSLN